MKVIHGGDIIGSFPKGFQIKFSVASLYVNKVATVVVNRLGSHPGGIKRGGAVHVFVAEKPDGDRLLSMLSTRCLFRCISSDTNCEELNAEALKWNQGEFDVLISTSIALV